MRYLAGFLVKTVAQGSMAWNIGLQGGDRVVVIDGKEVALGGDIILAGSPFKMSVLRAGKILELTGMSR